MSYRYGEYRDGPDPLAPPYDVRAALDQMGDAILSGSNPGHALRDLLKQGLPGAENRRGLDDLLREVRRRRRELRERGRLDGTLERARALLDKAIGQERAELFPDPSDDARFRESVLDGVPDDPAGAIQSLGSYDWRSAAARRTFEELRDLLRREVLDSQFRGMRQALADPDPAALERVREMMTALNDMLDRDARGEHTQGDFDDFMSKYGDMFPESPRNLEELVDALARRAAATQRLLASLTPAQREELAGLINQTLEQAGLADQMRRLGESLQSRRPDLAWNTPERLGGDEPLGMADAVTALDELADLTQLEAALRQDYPGARLDDVDEAAIRRALGRSAVDDLRALRQIERELEQQGYLQRRRGRLELTPKAVRRLGETALRRVFASLESGRRGDHDQVDAGAAGELTGSTRPWRFGDEQPIDVVRTVVNAVRRGPRHGGAVALSVDDFEVAETERRTAAAVCLLVDLSYSMALRGTWAAAKQTAMALQALVSSKFPQDSVQIVGFSNYARVLQPDELAGLEWDMVQGTNLHHALLIAGRHLDRHPDFEPVVLVVTDGEPTSHLRRNGTYAFEWPPTRETLELTLAEVDKMTRRRATLNVFMLAEDERLKEFVDEVARRNGGRVFSPSADRLGEYVVSDFLRTRRAR
ncbi:VWA domain-containing protein [Planomonospora sphaerica]|uniref:VWA domain-containing protein n=1 Tax=Planomonospora sphaerica TaxID=161355 RepID=A0A171DL74_9ACTN|nr:VWA domain-containing protein [Planomonospora sphaerica]GAT69592.1 VWA domain-containing protein [Planomonospora sphaerica]